jgi:hypothetical protein
MTGKPFSIAAARFAVGPIRKLAAEVQKQRIRVEAERARRSGMDSAAREQVFAGVIAYAALVASENPQEPTEQYAKGWAENWLRSRMPTLDPATILIMVQLMWLIYQALKAIGVFDSKGLSSLSADEINTLLGGL